MGTSTTSAQFSSKIIKMATITQARQKDIITQGALTAKEIFLAQAATQGITPAQKIASGRWNVRYDIKGFNKPTALVRFTGPFHLVNNATKPHYIVAKHLAASRSSGLSRAAIGGRGAFGGFFPTATSRRGTRNRAGKKALYFGGDYAASAQHPGTKGKKVFQHALPKVRRAVPIVMDKSIVAGWKRALR